MKEQRVSERAKRLYKKYAKLRDEHGLTDYQVAQDLGFNRARLSDWKSGYEEPKAAKIIAISRYFHVPITHFYDDSYK